MGKNSLIVLASHAPFSTSGFPIANTGFFLPEYFTNKKMKFVSIYNSLNGNTKPFVTEFGRIIKTNIITSKNLILKSLQELFIVGRVILKHKKIKIFIGIDPLNASFGVIFKFFGYIDHVIFYTADYSHTRFSNKFLNFIYHQIDQFACRFSDNIWNVSKKINQLRISQGFGSKTKVLPNAPMLKTRATPQLEKKDRYSVIIVSTLTKSVELENIISAFIKLKKKYTKLTLTIVGTPHLDQDLQKILLKHKYLTSVMTIDFMQHTDLIELLNRSGVGLALYKNNKDNPWIEFCDSMKARDYLASGLPVIISDFIPNAHEIEQNTAGFAINFEDKNSLTKAMVKIIDSSKTYEKYFNNALSLAKKNDAELLLNNYLSDYL